MKLIKEADLAKFKETWRQEWLDPLVIVKLFLPGTRRTRYLTEYEEETKIAFGYVLSGIDPLYDERGSVYIPELEEINIPWRVERDAIFEPKHFSLLKEELGIYD